jgi:hypothetical protein
MSNSAEARSGRSTALVLRNGATALATSLLLLAMGPAVAATFATFDVKNSTGTYAYAINSATSVTGFYTDSSGTEHGFIRGPDGTITKFDPEGSLLDIPRSINRKGAVTGDYYDSRAAHGFLRSAGGRSSGSTPTDRSPRML